MSLSELQQLPSPDPDAPDRVWARFQERRRRPQRPAGWWALPPALALGCAAAAWLLWPAATTERTLDASGTVVWSEQVTFSFDGSGTVTGVPRDAVVDWHAGTLRAEVEPNSGTSLAIQTEEARVQVVGTVFDVTRDRLGTTTAVTRGKVQVDCRDGVAALVTGHDKPLTCWPVTPAGLLGRADALVDAEARPADVLATLDRGVSAATAGTPVHGELLVRRMQTRAGAGQLGPALDDARTYLDHGQATRTAEVQRFLGWTLLAESGCAEALPHLEALAGTGTGDDLVLLAECLVDTDPARARSLIDDPRAASLEAAWETRAATVRAALEAR